MLFLLYISFTWPLSLGRQALGDITVDVLAQAKRMELAMTGQELPHHRVPGEVPGEVLMK